MIRAPRHSLLTASLFLAATSPVFAGELVFNGGFETGNFAGWFAPPNVPMQSNFWVERDGGHTGMHYAKLSSVPLQFLGQILPTEAGTDYELSFWLRRHLNSLDLFVVRWEGAAVFEQFFSLPTANEWHEFRISLHANITGSFLEFGQMAFPGEYHIDDISVVQVPAPSAAPLLLLGSAVAFRRKR